jgi:hypothetical protein
MATANVRAGGPHTIWGEKMWRWTSNSETLAGEIRWALRLLGDRRPSRLGRFVLLQFT